MANLIRGKCYMIKIKKKIKENKLKSPIKITEQENNITFYSK